MPQQMFFNIFQDIQLLRNSIATHCGINLLCIRFEDEQGVKLLTIQEMIKATTCNSDIYVTTQRPSSATLNRRPEPQMEQLHRPVKTKSQPERFTHNANISPSQILPHALPKVTKQECVIFCLDRSNSMTKIYGQGKLSRFQIANHLVSQLMEALSLNDTPKQVGLVTFGSSVSYDCELTEHYLDIIPYVNNLTCKGETPLFDALFEAGRILRNTTASDTKKRIIAISDGDDTTSAVTNTNTKYKLKRWGICVDIIVFDDVTRVKECHAICKETGGTCERIRNMWVNN
jgi:Mg-chelatase subunit ChlD